MVLFGTVVVVDLGVVVLVVAIDTVVVVDMGVVVLVVSFGTVVVVDLGVVVVLVAEGTTVVVEFAGDSVVDGSLATVPEFPNALEPPVEIAVHVVEATKVDVVFDVPEDPLKPLAGVPGFPSVDCDVE